MISSLVCERFDAAIARFHDRHPRVEILIDITTWDSVAAALLRDEIDIGVAPAQTLRSDLSYDFLFDESHGAYCGPTHPLFGKTFDDPSALSKQAFVLTGADEPDVLTAFRTRHGLGLQVAGLSEHLDERSDSRCWASASAFFPKASPRPMLRLAGCGRCCIVPSSRAFPCSSLPTSARPRISRASCSSPRSAVAGGGTLKR